MGIIGSLLNIAVFYQRHLRTNSCSVYFISTSIFNFLVIMFGVIPTMFTAYLSYDYAAYSTSYCKFRGYIVHAVLMMSRSSVALACIDRFALCSSNVRIRALNQHRMAIRLISVISILWLLIPIHMIVEINVQNPPPRCGASGTYSIIYSVYAAIVTAIPLTIMVVFSTLASQHLKRSRARVRPTAGSNVPITDQIKKRDGQFIIILISEVIVYFFSTILFPVYSIYSAVTSKTVKDANRTAIEGFIRYLALSFFIYVNSCSIFYIHLLASKTFRQECKRLILNLYKREQNNNLSSAAGQITNTQKQSNRIHDQDQIET
jgi:hypothetical protein